MEDKQLTNDTQLEEYAELSFKQLSAEIEQVVRSLESNQLELEESLSQYEKGVKLIAIMQQRLKEAEQKVEVLMGEIEPVVSEEVDTRLS